MDEVENTQEIINEQKSSVEVTKNSKGDNWKVKVYDIDADKAIEKTFELEGKCYERYGEKLDA